MYAAYYQFCRGLLWPWDKQAIKMPRGPSPASKEGHTPHVSCTRELQGLPTNDECSTGSTLIDYLFKRLTVLGRAGAYVFIYVPRDHPSFEVWFGSTLDIYEVDE